jgi:hypothetical protein
MNISIIEHDEILAVSALLRASGSKPITKALAGLRYDFHNRQWQMLYECWQESRHDNEPLNAALKRRLVQAGNAPNEHDALLEMARIQQDLPPMGIPSMEELTDAIERLNRSMVVKDAQEALDLYHNQSRSYSETLETLKAMADDEPGAVDLHSMEDVIVEFENWTPPERVQFGFEKLDHYCKGIERRRMTILAARPGVGKSDLALHMARHNLQQGRNVLIATIEMDAAEVSHRIGMAEGHGASWRACVDNGLKKIQLWPGRLRIYDAASQSVAQIAARVQDDDDLVIVDYLQIVQPRTRSSKRYEIVTELSNDLRAGAKRSNAAWLVLSQLSRQARTEKEVPVLSDLRESGAIEQDANGVVFIWEPDGKSDTEIQSIEIGVAKNRGGRLGNIAAEVNRPSHTWRES